MKMIGKPYSGKPIVRLMREGLDIESFGLLRLFSLDSSYLMEYFEYLFIPLLAH